MLDGSVARVLEFLGKTYTIKKIAVWSEDPVVVNAFLDLKIFPTARTIYWIRQFGVSLKIEDIEPRVLQILPESRSMYIDPPVSSVDLAFIACPERELSGNSGWQRRLHIVARLQGRAKILVAPDMQDNWYKDMFKAYKHVDILVGPVTHVGVASDRAAIKIPRA